MKRSVVLFILSLAVMVAAHAQAVEVSLSSGYVLPASPMTFARYWKIQAGGGIGVGAPVSPFITVLGSIEYYRYRLNEDGIRSAFDTRYMQSIWIFSDVSQQPSASTSSITTVAASARIEAPPGEKFLSPYFLAGGGAMFSSFGEIALPTTSILALDGTNVAIQAQQKIIGGTETTAFFQLGLGLDARLNDLVKLFIEARLGFGMSRSIGTAYVPITAGVRVQL